MSIDNNAIIASLKRVNDRISNLPDVDLVASQIVSEAIDELCLDDTISTIKEDFSKQLESNSIAIEQVARSTVTAINSLNEQIQEHSDTILKTNNIIGESIDNININLQSMSEADEQIRGRVSSVETDISSIHENYAPLQYHEQLRSTVGNLGQAIDSSIEDINKNLSDAFKAIETKSDIGHEHDYALPDHTHDQYALNDHEHDYALPDHEHDYTDNFSPLVHEHDQYALEGHEHDYSDRFSPLVHTHDQYATNVFVGKIETVVKKLGDELVKKQPVGQYLSQSDFEPLKNEIIQHAIQNIPVPKDGKDALMWEFKAHPSKRAVLLYRREDWGDFQEIVLFDERIIQNIQRSINKQLHELYEKAIKGTTHGGMSFGVSAGAEVSNIYTNLTPVPNTIGGIVSGTTFDNVPISDVLDMLLYPFNVTLTVSPSTAEFGTNVEPTLSFTTKTGALSTINRNVGHVTISPVSANETVSETTTWTITSSFGTMTRTASATTQFMNRIYWGVTPSTAPTNVEIGNASNQLSNTKTRSITYDCTGGNRYWIAYPSRLGDMTNIRVNNMPNNAFVRQVISFTNQHGYTEDYTVYTSINLVYGSNIPVQWA